jgi:hypothetical protein
MSSAEKPRSSAGAQQRTRPKPAAENAFGRYMKKNYVEHFRRVMSWRRAAKWVLLTYPLMSAMLFAAPCLIFMFVFDRLYRSKPEWFSNVLSPESQAFVMPVIYAIIIASTVFGLLTGIVLGISRSRLLTFEAERTELAVRQNYFLRRIARGQRSTRRRTLDSL